MQRQLVDMLLAEDAPTVVNAGSGREALEFLKDHTPHLVILAFELPDIGGDRVCSKLKSVSRLSPVPVILTIEPPGRNGIPHDVRERARSVGADLVLPKPLGDKGLRDRVRQLLARWEAPTPPAKRPTKNTVVLEEALEELGGAGPDPTSNPVTDALYRENEDLRQEVASLKRRLARLEAGLPSRDGLAETSQTIVAGPDPATPSDAAPPPDPATDAGTLESPADRAGDEPRDRVDELEYRVRELERRNKALLAALEEAKAESEESPRGLFKRRRS